MIFLIFQEAYSNLNYITLFAKQRQKRKGHPKVPLLRTLCPIRGAFRQLVWVQPHGDGADLILTRSAVMTGFAVPKRQAQCTGR